MKSIRQAVVITSIYPPGEAVRQFARAAGWQLYVVGDRKTPSGWAWENVCYISPAEQKKLGYRIGAKLPWNHYARKMIGYLAAMEAGAGVIADTDDDNIPRDDWGFPPFTGSYLLAPPFRDFVNVYTYFSPDDRLIWPRGFPLAQIRTAPDLRDAASLPTRNVRVGIWQGLADGSPDVDAVYRLVFDRPCVFRDLPPLVLDRGSVCPVNSQNTAFVRKAFPLLYLPAFVSFRFTDILRGLVAQPILWQAGYRTGFIRATVVQQRNPHDDFRDFASEIPVYLHSPDIVAHVEEAVAAGASVADNLFRAYETLQRHKIVAARELALLEAWLADLEALAPAVAAGDDDEP